VDNMCDSSGVVALGHGEFLHAWGIHSHSAGARGDRPVGPIVPGTKARIVVAVPVIVRVPIAGAKQKK
jgi:hypothetical protein